MLGSWFSVFVLADKLSRVLRACFVAAEEERGLALLGRLSCSNALARDIGIEAASEAMGSCGGGRLAWWEEVEGEYFRGSGRKGRTEEWRREIGREERKYQAGRGAKERGICIDCGR